MFKLTSKRFQTEYGLLTPSNILQISTKNNEEKLATILKRPQPKNKHPYQVLQRRKYEQCTMEHSDPTIASYFPVDLDIIEILWNHE